MKKVVFTLGAVSVVCACGLVIDPDKLVEGNANPISAPNEAGSDTGGGGGDDSGGGGSDASSDVSTDAPIVEVPECVPPLPTTPGAQGPYAVVTANAGDPAPSCPPGYLPAPVLEGKGSLFSTPVECNSSAGCSCGAGSGTPKCGLRVRYYDDSACTKEADTPDTFSICMDLDSENYLKLEYSVSSVTCGAGSGSATPTAKSTPSYRTQYVVCSPDPAVKTAVCKGSDIPLPQAKNADACIIVPLNASCFGSGSAYDGAINLSKAGTFTDNRTCACGCTAAQSNCTGGTASIHSQIFCGGTTANMNVGDCTARATKNYIQTASSPSPAGGAPTCSTRATPSGEVTPTYDAKLCCLSSGGN